VRYSAAVAVESERTGTQRLHIVAEVRDPDQDGAGLSHLVRDIVQRVQRGRGHRPARVLLLRPGAIPKTSSGKIQRSRLSQMLRDDSLAEYLLRVSGAGRSGTSA
jgi:fatty-acyl-CoA synthase